MSPQSTWEPMIAEKIVHRIAENVTNDQNHGPLLVGIVGIPGSGKTTSSQMLSQILTSSKIGNIIIPMDGYHYPLSRLQTFDDPADAIYRRGAPDTFDSKSLKQDLMKIKHGNDKDMNNNDDNAIVRIPGFDHSKGDPEPDLHIFRRCNHSVVICEGLYLLHNGDGWSDNGIQDLFDITVFIDANVDVCVDRLKVRNLCIPGYTQEEILIRCEQVDRVNAMTVLQCREKADFVVKSVAL